MRRLRTLIVTALAAVFALPLAGCSWMQVEDRIVEAEAALATLDANVEDVQTTVAEAERIVDELEPIADSVQGTLGAQVREALHAARGVLEHAPAILAGYEADREALTAILADLRAAQAEGKDATLSVIVAGLDVVSVLLGGGTIGAVLAAVSGVFARRKGREEGAEAVARSVGAARAADPTFNAAFDVGRAGDVMRAVMTDPAIQRVIRKANADSVGRVRQTPANAA